VKDTLAIGEASIQTDEMVFRYGEEIFAFSPMEVWNFIDWNPRMGFYQADVRKLRRLAREKANGLRRKN
jgi:hypothetical protein